MQTDERLASVVATPERLRQLGPDIHTLLPGADPQLYDGFAGAYDAVVGTWLYNRVVWGNAPRDYAAFAERALGDSAQGWLLDAGGGSLLFTANVYAKHATRPILVLDQSVAMLARARTRLTRVSGGHPGDHVTLLQADLRDLSALRPGAFTTILCLNVLHHITDAVPMLAGLRGLAATGARLYLTSLVRAERLSDWYLERLERGAGFAPARTPTDVVRALEAAGFTSIQTVVRGNMLYAVADRGPTSGQSND